MPFGLFAYPAPSMLSFEERASAIDNHLAEQAARVGRLDAVTLHRANQGFLGKMLWLCLGRPRKIAGLQRLANENLDTIRINAMLEELAILNGQTTSAHPETSTSSLKEVTSWRDTPFWHALQFYFSDFRRVRFSRHRVIWQSS